MAPGAPPVTAFYHLAELRRRVLVCAAIMFAGSCLGFALREPVVAVLQRPLGQELYYTSPQGSFDFVVRVSMLIGLFLTLPAAVYNLLRFIEPALSKPLGRRLPILAVVSSGGLTLGGAAFAYYVGLPAALHFFAGVGTPQLHALIGADRYFSFVLAYVATFAVVFHLPLLLLLINHVTPLGPSSLARWRKWVIVGAFAVALVIPSAPDPLSQIILAVPLIILYELSVCLVWLANRRHKPAPASVKHEPAKAGAHANTLQPAMLDLSSRSKQFPSRQKSGRILDLRP